MAKLTVFLAILLISLPFVVAEAHQAGQDKTPLNDTVVWMANFSRLHGFMRFGDGIQQTNYVSAVDGCRVLIDHNYPESKDADKIRHGKEIVNLGDFDPGNVKNVTYKYASGDTFELQFERTDSAMKIEREIEMGDGSKTKMWLANETLFFDESESAERFAKALSHAITLCGGVHSPF